jgi:hypothetical protein
VIDLQGGADSLTLANGFNTVTVMNIENVTGGNSNDTILIGNATGSTTVTAGLGFDVITASAGQDSFRFTGVADSQSGSGDTVNNFNAIDDRFVYSGFISNGSDAVTYVGTDTAFAVTNHSQARLDTSLGGTLLQIDVNGDGVMNASDIEVHLTNLAGTLHNSNFALA